MARVLLGSVGIARRMFSGAVARWTEHGRPTYLATVDAWRSRPWHELSEPEILSAVRELTEAVIDAYGALVSGAIPAAWITEGAFTLVCTVVARSDVPASTYLTGFDSIPIRSEKSLYDLAQWARGSEPLAGHLRRTPAARLADELADERPPDGIEPAVWRGWRTRVHRHLQQYGGTIYNLDFAAPYRPTTRRRCSRPASCTCAEAASTHTHASATPSNAEKRPPSAPCSAWDGYAESCSAAPWRPRSGSLHCARTGWWRSASPIPWCAGCSSNWDAG